MHDEPGRTWPHLGFRFDRVRQHQGDEGLFTCRAHDLLLDRGVSLRVCTASATMAERDAFAREAEALQRIGTHPAVIGLIEVARQADLDILVLEDAQCGVAGVLTPRAAVHTVLALAGAVETAHRLGILHGCIEPDNVWMDLSGRAMLAGFEGRLDDASPPLLQVASPHTAPEVLLGEALDESVDVYGLGSTLFELIAGAPAIRSYPGESPAALSLRVLTGTTVSLERAGVPFGLVDVIGWSMAVDRGDRPPSVAWLAEELGRVERSQGWPRTKLHIGARPEKVVARRRATRHRAG